MKLASNWLLSDFFPQETMSWILDKLKVDSNIDATSIFDSIWLYTARRSGKALEMKDNIVLVCYLKRKRQVKNLVPAIKIALVKIKVM